MRWRDFGAIGLLVCGVFGLPGGCDEEKQPAEILYDKLEQNAALGLSEEFEVRVSNLPSDVTPADLNEALRAEVDWERAQVAPGQLAFEADDDGVSAWTTYRADPWELAAYLRGLVAVSERFPDVVFQGHQQLGGEPMMEVHDGEWTRGAETVGRFLELMERPRWDYEGTFEHLELCGELDESVGEQFRTQVQAGLKRRIEPSRFDIEDKGAKSCISVDVDGDLRPIRALLRTVMQVLFTMPYQQVDGVAQPAWPFASTARLTLSGEEERTAEITSDRTLMMLDWEMKVAADPSSRPDR